MSPAAQRLASTKLGIRTHTDKSLRSSYTPSPIHRQPGVKTPTPGQNRTPKGHTPKSLRGTPKGGSSSREGGTPLVRTPRTPVPDVSASLTDNLLNLPRKRPVIPEQKEENSNVSDPTKRARAEDFF